MAYESKNIRKNSITVGGTKDDSAILDLTSTTQGLGLPNLTTTERDSISTPKTGLQIFNTTTSTLNVYDGTSWTEAGAGGGGEKNYISNPDAESGTTGWVGFDDVTALIDGTGGTATNIPLTSQGTTILAGNKSFKMTKTGTATFEGVSFDFTIDKADMLNVLKIEFDYNTDGTYTAGDIQVSIYDKDTSTLITPRVTEITGYDKDNSGSVKFVSDYSPVDVTSTNYRLIFHVVDTTTNVWDFYFDNVVVGPGVRAQGAVVGATTEYSDELDSTVTAFWRQKGEWMEITWRQETTAADVAEEIFLPSGYTIDTSIVGTSTVNYSLGTGTFFDSGTGTYEARASYATSTTLHLRYDNGTALAGLPALANGDLIFITATIPIAEWAGTGTVALGANDVEYAFNTDLTVNIDDTTSFGYGPGGTQFAAHTVQTQKRVQFQTPIQATDRIEIEYFVTDTWLPVHSSALAALDATHGLQMQRVSSTQMDIVFGASGYGAVLTTGGNAWSTIDLSDHYKWRVVKHRSGIPVGFGAATSEHSGLVKLNKWKQKIANATFTSGNILTISGLETGLTYRATFHIYGATAIRSRAYIKEDGNIISLISKDELAGTTGLGSVIFVATGSTLTMDYIDGSIRGNNTLAETWLQVEEFKNLGTQTTDFT